MCKITHKRYTVRNPFRVNCEQIPLSQFVFTLAPLLMLVTNMRYVFDRDKQMLKQNTACNIFYLILLSQRHFRIIAQQWSTFQDFFLLQWYKLSSCKNMIISINLLWRFHPKKSVFDVIFPTKPLNQNLLLRKRCFERRLAAKNMFSSILATNC